jgi:hypothetical protein
VPHGPALHITLDHRFIGPLGVRSEYSRAFDRC